MYSHGVICMEVLWRSTYFESAQNMCLTQLALLQEDGWPGLGKAEMNFLPNLIQFLEFTVFFWFPSQGFFFKKKKTFI
jgi:hypothetical protein